MPDSIEDLSFYVERLRATVSILECFSFALYDGIQNKNAVIEMFSTLSDRASVTALYSGNSDEFYDEIDEKRAQMIAILTAARDA